MEEISFKGYKFYISRSLRPIINENLNRFIIFHEAYKTICMGIEVLDNGELKLESFLGINFELADDGIYIYDEGDDYGNTSTI